MKLVRQLSLLTTCGALMLAATFQAALAQTAAPVLSEAAIVAQADSTALTPDQVLDRLKTVPVFAIVSENNSPVLANIEQNGEQVQLISFWLDQKAAQTALSNVQQANPSVGGQARLVSLPMPEALRVAREQQENEIQVRIWPDVETLEVALNLLRQTAGQEDADRFPGVPLFYGESEAGVLTLEANGSEVVPFFFHKDDLEATLNRAGAENADIAARTQVRVTSLNTVMNSMVSPNAEANVQKIEFVPSRAAIEYAREIAPAQ
ncbi:Tic22 family protein [Synechococcus sp. PCC 7336]|uniref:Tic22 family protein n=1 Tax=Synechococcus sp. PCC 7336 TaxID=195250 RepID=UPI00034965EB|nr:Tic22 family protein [Synechococcus sp. PCC 7336]